MLKESTISVYTNLQQDSVIPMKTYSIVTPLHLQLLFMLSSIVCLNLGILKKLPNQIYVCKTRASYIFFEKGLPHSFFLKKVKIVSRYIQRPVQNLFEQAKFPFSFPLCLKGENPEKNCPYFSHALHASGYILTSTKLLNGQICCKGQHCTKENRPSIKKHKK